MPEDGEDAKLMATYLSNRSVLIAKALNDILTREQLLRFRQIVLQQLEAGVRVDYPDNCRPRRSIRESLRPSG